MDTLTLAWAADFGPRGHRVNASSLPSPPPGGNPGSRVFAVTAHAGPAEDDDRQARPDEPAARTKSAAALFTLASDYASFLTALSFDVDGGRNRVAVIRR